MQAISFENLKSIKVGYFQLKIYILIPLVNALPIKD